MSCGCVHWCGKGQIEVGEGWRWRGACTACSTQRGALCSCMLKWFAWPDSGAWNERIQI